MTVTGPVQASQAARAWGILASGPSISVIRRHEIASSRCILRSLFSSAVAQTDVPSIPSHDAFFSAISELCGKAFSGTVTVDNDSSDTFANKQLIMHVRRCDDTQLQIPFHVGDDASRTWLITKTVAACRSSTTTGTATAPEDTLTPYGGHTVDAGWAQVQSFPADQYQENCLSNRPYRSPSAIRGRCISTRSDSPTG